MIPRKTDPANLESVSYTSHPTYDKIAYTCPEPFTQAFKEFGDKTSLGTRAHSQIVRLAIRDYLQYLQKGGTASITPTPTSWGTASLHRKTLIIRRDRLKSLDEIGEKLGGVNRSILIREAILALMKRWENSVSEFPLEDDL